MIACTRGTTSRFSRVKSFVAPLHATATSRSPGASWAVACARARSCITSRPASTAASTAGTGDHARGDEQQSLATDAEARGDQAQGEPEPAKRREHQYSESTGV